MARVYSSLLGRYTFGGSGTVTFTVPAGFVWVVRSLSAFNPGTVGGGTGHGFSFTVNGQYSLYTVSAPYIVPQWQYHLDTRQVLDEGDNLDLVANDGGWSLYASGYALALP